MSGRCTGWVLKHGPTDRAMRLVLITIADAANSDGEHAHPGIASMVEGSLYSRGTVNRVVRRLAAEGWIEVETQGGGRGLSTVYRVPMKPRHGDAVLDEKPRHLATETASSEGDRGPETASSPYLDAPPNGLDTQRKDSQRVEAAASALCELLADQVEANGCKRPAVGRAWLDSARLLLVRDHRPPREAADLVRWVTADEFWRANVLSMPTFRRQYDRLRLARDRPNGTRGYDQLAGLREYREATNGP